MYLHIDFDYAILLQNVAPLYDMLWHEPKIEICLVSLQLRTVMIGFEPPSHIVGPVWSNRVTCVG